MRILILDNYDSFTYNLVQLAGMVSGTTPMVVRNDELSFREFMNLRPDAVIISAGPGRPDRSTDFGICRDVIDAANVPVLGVCLGFQGIVWHFGGKIIPAPEPVHGRADPIFHSDAAMFSGIPNPVTAVRYHSLMVHPQIPDELIVTAETSDNLIMAVRHRTRPIWGVQYHPESICSGYGDQLMHNFLKICESRPSRLSRCSTPTRKLSNSSDLSFIAQLQSFAPDIRLIPEFPDPEAVFRSCFADQEVSFWLDSSSHQSGNARFTIMGAADAANSFVLTCTSSGETLTCRLGSRDLKIRKSIWQVLEFLSEINWPEQAVPFHFTGGMIGYLGYEMKTDCGGSNRHSSPWPDAQFIFPGAFLVFDHQEKRLYACEVKHQDGFTESSPWLTRVMKIINRIQATDSEKRTGNDRNHQSGLESNSRFKPSVSASQYKTHVQKCRELIADGESYEICLTGQMQTDQVIDSLETYCSLRKSNPAPYSAFLKFRDLHILCSSPELLLQADTSGSVISKPIKGTAPRHPDEKWDRKRKEDLRSSIKNRSENLMITDLVRNDLGRECKIGSVQVPSLMEIESYQTVHQMVSTIKGQLRENRTAAHCLKALFPPGSMTGAPKIRTMEFIDDLEKGPRGIYSGSLGFLALNGSACLNVIIRTLVADKNGTSLGSGGAVVALSDPDDEWNEFLLKTHAPLKAVQVQTHSNRPEK